MRGWLLALALLASCASEVATEGDEYVDADDVGVSASALTTVTTNNTDVTLAGAPKALAMAACYAMQWSGISAYNCLGGSNTATCSKLFGAGSGPNSITVNDCVAIGGLAPVPTPPGGTASLTHRCRTPQGAHAVERGLSSNKVVYIFNRGASNRMTCRAVDHTLWFNYP
jgi:hypothetical protein